MSKPINTSSAGKPKRPRENERPITFWLPTAEAEALNRRLQAQVAGVVGARVSRQAHLRSLVLADAAGELAPAAPAPSPAAVEPAPKPESAPPSETDVAGILRRYWARCEEQGWLVVSTPEHWLETMANIVAGQVEGRILDRQCLAELCEDLRRELPFISPPPPPKPKSRKTTSRTPRKRTAC